MKFTRTDLIARVEATIARCEQIAADKTAKAAAEYERNLGRHVGETAEAWAAFAATIRRRVRAGKPITTADIPGQLRHGYGSGIRLWDTKPPTPTVANTAAHHALLGLLKACTDDEISDAALQRLGFRATDHIRP